MEKTQIHEKKRKLNQEKIELQKKINELYNNPDYKELRQVNEDILLLQGEIRSLQRTYEAMVNIMNEKNNKKEVKNNA